jgi:K+-sensing histidine kinase KdpD
VALERDAYAAKAGAEALRRQGDRVKADLLSAVSHDLRTPLSTILIALQSLRRFEAEHDLATRSELLALAETETARLSGLVGNLLDMSRIEADAVAVRLAPASLAELVLSALDRAALAVAHRAVNNRMTDAAQVLIDYSLAEIALANVIENAAKYSPAGTPIEIRGGGDGVMAAIEVLDEGPGFPDAVEPLFERFARGVEGDGRPAGTGLGLAIARGFLEAQGGWIEARNRDNRAGALVRIHLPLAGADAPP